MGILAPESLLGLLLWIVVGLFAQLVLLILTGAWLQIRRNRFTRFRIACHRRWEEEVVAFLFAEPRDPSPFLGMPDRERRLLIPFLIRIQGTLAGAENEAARTLYQAMALDRGIEARLSARHSKIRALAALEAGSFQVASCYPRLLVLLKDPVPHVAHAAARSLASTRDLAFAEAVLHWVLTQEAFQRERLLWILEGFGPELLDWLEQRLDADPDTASGPGHPVGLFYALLAASSRRVDCLPRLLRLLHSADLDVQVSAIKALGALGVPDCHRELLPFTTHPEWVLRSQVAKVLGILGGVEALPHLIRLLEDEVFDVRRNAAYALTQAGPAGVQALEWIAGDPDADPFARDLAHERLQWAHQRGRS